MTMLYRLESLDAPPRKFAVVVANRHAEHHTWFDPCEGAHRGAWIAMAIQRPSFWKIGYRCCESILGVAVCRIANVQAQMALRVRNDHFPSNTVYSRRPP